MSKLRERASALILRRPGVTFVAIILVGIALFFWLQHSAGAPERRAPRDRGRAVRVFTLQSIAAIPRATGFGTVEAQRTWQGVAEVGGTILEMAPEVEVGRVVPEGTLLFRINPESVLLEKNRTEASVRGVRAQIGELQARETSARASLLLEKKVLDMAQNDVARASKAHAAGLAPLTDVESAERALLSAQRTVQGLENTLLELPAARRVLDAQVAQQQAGAEGARLGLAKTELVAPFRMRIRQLNASVQQTVNAGQVILIGDGTDVLEIVAHMPVGVTGPLMGPRRTSGTGDGNPLQSASLEPDTSSPEPNVGAADVSPPAATDQPARPASDAPGGPRRSAISAIVRLKAQGIERTWSGNFRRFQGVDPATRTVGVVVEVNESRRQQGGSGLPLLPGLHVEVELSGAPREDCLAIPRSALHDDKVYVVGNEDRLDVRKVVADLIQENYVCVESGLVAGEQIVLTDLSPAVQGMLLAPRADSLAVEIVQAAASGKPMDLTSQEVIGAPSGHGGQAATAASSDGPRSRSAAGGASHAPRRQRKPE